MQKPENDKIAYILVMIDDSVLSIAAINQTAWDELQALEGVEADEFAMELYSKANDETDPDYVKYSADVPDLSSDYPGSEKGEARTDGYDGVSGYGAWLRHNGIKIGGEYVSYFY